MIGIKQHGQWLLLALLLISSPARSETPRERFGIGFSIVNVHFHPSQAMEPSFGAGGSLAFNLTDDLRAILIVNSMNTVMKYDKIGGAGNLDIGLLLVHLEARYLLAHFGSVLDIESAIGGGLVSISTSGQTISLGALGQMEVPERSETHPAYLAGVVLSHRVNRVMFEVRPSVLLLGGETLSNPQYVIAGGVSLDI